jgi:hypothetical protein
VLGYSLSEGFPKLWATNSLRVLLILWFRFPGLGNLLLSQILVRHPTQCPCHRTRLGRAVYLASLIEEREKERAMERMSKGGQSRGGHLATPSDETGKSRDIVAATVGMSESK